MLDYSIDKNKFQLDYGDVKILEDNLKELMKGKYASSNIHKIILLPNPKGRAGQMLIVDPEEIDMGIANELAKDLSKISPSPNFKYILVQTRETLSYDEEDWEEIWEKARRGHWYTVYDRERKYDYEGRVY